MDRTNVVLGSYDTYVRLGLRTACVAAPGLGVIGAFASRATLLTAARNVDGPAVTIVDVAMLGPHPETLVRDLAATAARVLLYGGDAAVDALPELLRAGARGFVSASGEVGELVPAVQTVADGQVALTDEVQRRVTAGLLELHDAVPRLSVREREILRLAGEGLSSEQIADELHVSESTVKTYLARASKKLGVQGRVAAVTRAMRLGLLR